MRGPLSIALFLGSCSPSASTVLTLDFDLGGAEATADRLVATIRGENDITGNMIAQADVTVEYIDGAMVLTRQNPGSTESVNLEATVSSTISLNIDAEATSGAVAIATGRAQARVVPGEWWRVDVALECVNDCIVPDGGPDAGDAGVEPAIPTIDLASDSADLTISGAGEGDRAHVVASGDIDDDGKPDLIVGVPNSNGPDGTRGDAGGVYVLLSGDLGCADAIDLGNLDCNGFIRLDGADPGDLLGSSIAIGNVNDDAYNDLIIGAPGADGPLEDRPEAGEVYVLLGRNFSAQGVEDEFDFREASYNARVAGRDGDRLGTSVAAGNLDTGSFADLVLGAPGYAGLDNMRVGAGAAFVVLGGSSLTLSSALEIDLAEGEYALVLLGPEGTALGTSVATARINGDSYDDLVAGAPNGPGAAYVLLGRAAFSTTSVDAAIPENEWTLRGPGPGAAFGWSLAAGSFDDVEGMDVAVGAPARAGMSSDGGCAGAVYVFSGDAGLLPTEKPVEVDATAARVTVGEGCDGFGMALAAGPLVGEALDDLVVGAPRWQSGKGLAVVLSAGDTPVLQVQGAAIDNHLGLGVSVGDLGGQAGWDVVASAPLFDPGTPIRENAGRAYVIFDPAQ